MEAVCSFEGIEERVPAGGWDFFCINYLKWDSCIGIIVTNFSIYTKNSEEMDDKIQEI